MKLSIILPAYNVENYIDTCLESMLNQDLDSENYEIIAVNDGSTDSTLQHLKDFQQGNINIKIISQENRGLSAARNRGVKEAVGEYIWFIDSDDMICPCCLKGLLAMCDLFQTDMFCVGPSVPFLNVFPEDFIQNRNNYVSMPCNGENWIKSNQSVIGAWSYIIRRSFWTENALQFVEGMYFEDTECMSRSFYFGKRIGGLNKFSVYNYVQREQSTMHSPFSEHKLKSLSTLIHSLNAFSTQVVSVPFFHSYYQEICLGAYMNGLKQIAKNEDLKIYLAPYVNEVRKSGGVKLMASSFSKRLYQFIAIHFPTAFIRMTK